MKRQETTKPNALDEDQYELRRCENNDGDHDVVHLNVKYASCKEKSLFYGDVPDDGPIDSDTVEVG
jgi:hypothetical protein